MLNINKKYNISNLDDSELKILADYLTSIETVDKTYDWYESLKRLSKKEGVYIQFLNKTWCYEFGDVELTNINIDELKPLRYFYVVTLTQENNNTIFSSFDYVNKKYPSMTELKNIALEKFKNIKKVDTIISITEMNKDDYNEFVKE